MTRMTLTGMFTTAAAKFRIREPRESRECESCESSNSNSNSLQFKLSAREFVKLSAREFVKLAAREFEFKLSAIQTLCERV